MQKYLFANRFNETTDFTYIGWEDIKERVKSPYSCDKQKAPVIGMHDARAKTKEVILDHNSMTMLWADIDETTLTINQIRIVLIKNGIDSFIIYSTVSAAPDKPRWRVLIELEQSLDCKTWVIVQKNIAIRLGGDSCAHSVQQIAFLPNKVSGHFKHYINDGPALKLAGHHLLIPPLPAQEKPKPAPTPKLTVVDSPIADFNKSHFIPDLLDKYQFKKMGKKWIYPNSASGIPGVELLDDKYFSHHTSDPLCDGHKHDAFDLFVEYEHSGNKKKALSTLDDNEPFVPYYMANSPNKKKKDLGCNIYDIDEFIKGGVTLDYILDDILLRGFLYAITGPTGTGKTAIALMLGLCVATGRTFAGKATEKGHVLYCAGENPLDIKMRIIAATKEMGIDTEKMFEYFHIQEGVENMNRIEVSVLNNGYNLVIVDTLPAYFNGDDSNSNDQVKKFARDKLRPFCALRGTPTVIALCHPVKDPSKENNIPYGGGALLNEVDGNIGLWGDKDEPKELYVCRKLRGVTFEPLHFTTREVTHPAIKDKRGKLITTVIAVHITDLEYEKMDKKERIHENELMASMLHHPRMNFSDRAKHLGWLRGNGKPNGQRVQRRLEALKKHELIINTRGGYRLTKRGKEEAGYHAKKEAY